MPFQRNSVICTISSWIKSVDPQIICSSLFSHIFNTANIFSFIAFLPKYLHYMVPCGVVHQSRLIILNSIFMKNLSKLPKIGTGHHACYVTFLQISPNMILEIYSLAKRGPNIVKQLKCGHVWAKFDIFSYIIIRVPNLVRLGSDSLQKLSQPNDFNNSLLNLTRVYKIKFWPKCQHFNCFTLWRTV